MDSYLGVFMKLFIAALFFTQSLFAGLPPTTTQGIYQTAKPTTFNFQVPERQATQTSGINSLLETGNQNLLINPSFEHSAASTGWTLGTSVTGVQSLSASAQISGKKILNVTSTTTAQRNLTQNISSVARATAPFVGLNMEAAIYISNISNATDLQVCATSGATDVSCVNVDSSTTGWKQYVVNFPGSATDFGITVKQTGTASRQFLADNAYVGLARNVGTVAQAQWVGAVKYVGATNCVWNIASATFANGAVDPDCNTATATGAVTAPGTKIPAIVIPSLAPGAYRFVAKGTFLNGTAGAVCSFRFSDGTNSTISNRVGITSAAANAQMPVIEGEIVYTTPQSNLTINIQAAESGASSCQIAAPVATLGDLEISVYYSPTQSQTAVRMDQSNFGWTDFPSVAAGTLITAVTTSPAYGTVAVNKAQYRRVGGDMEIRWDYRQTATAGSSAGSGMYLFNLPPGFSIDTARAIANTGTGLGGAFNSSSSIGFFRGGYDTTGIVDGNVNVYNSTQLKIKFALQSSSVGAYVWGSSAAFGKFTDYSDLSFGLYAKVPIVGWTENQNAPLLVGGVTSSSQGITRIESFAFGGGTDSSNCTSTPCTLYRNNSVGITVARASTGNYSFTFPAGMFSAGPVCNFSAYVIGTGPTACMTFGIPTATSYPSIFCGIGAGVDVRADVICVGPR
jgi:hypothetical protein